MMVMDAAATADDVGNDIAADGDDDADELMMIVMMIFP